MYSQFKLLIIQKSQNLLFVATLHVEHVQEDPSTVESKG